MISYFLLLDFPASTKKLSDRERRLAISRLQAGEVSSYSEDTPRLGSLEALRQSITNWRTSLLTAGYMVIVGSSTLSYFYPTLVQGLGYDGHMAQYMVCSCALILFTSFWAWLSPHFPVVSFDTATYSSSLPNIYIHRLSLSTPSPSWPSPLPATSWTSSPNGAGWLLPAGLLCPWHAASSCAPCTTSQHGTCYSS